MPKKGEKLNNTILKSKAGTRVKNTVITNQVQCQEYRQAHAFNFFRQEVDIKKGNIVGAIVW